MFGVQLWTQLAQDCSEGFYRLRRLSIVQRQIKSLFNRHWLQNEPNNKRSNFRRGTASQWHITLEVKPMNFADGQMHRFEIHVVAYTKYTITLKPG